MTLVEVNALGQPLGSRVDGWKPPPPPPREPMEGRTCRLEPLDVERHATDLHAANALDTDYANWTCTCRTVRSPRWTTTSCG